jgi:RHS repeat-associated protein
MTHTFDYCGNMVYEDGLLSYILNPAGRALPTGQAHEYTYEYFLNDHLGNVRVVFGDPDRDHEAEVIQENHYYPFGMTMAGLDYSAGLENRYLYQGKELTGDFNLWWSDFHARRFDSQLGRWHVPDPAGQFASAYMGMGNNPVSLTDLDGMWAVGTYGGYSRMLAAVGRGLALMYQDYYDWIDQFSARIGFKGNVILWDPTMRIGGGNQQTQSKPSEGQYAIYDGQYVTWYDANGKAIEINPGTSGYIEGDKNFQNSKYQNKKDLGPIPEGTYSIDLTLNPYRQAKIIEWKPDELYDDIGIQQIPTAFPLTDGRMAINVGWGSIRARLEYVSGNLYGREGFYIHNSTKGFTHGCIEVGGNFFSRLLNYSQYFDVLYFYVDYPYDNSSTRGETWKP